MTYQFRVYRISILIVAGLMVSSLRAAETVVVPAYVGYLAVGCIAGVLAYKAHDYFNPTNIRLTEIEKEVGTIKTGMAAFKAETATNFSGVLQGQEKLVQGQATLQEHVVDVEKQVSAAREDIEGVREITVSIKSDTTDLKKDIREARQKLDEINAQLAAQLKKVADIDAQIAASREATKKRLEQLQSGLDTVVKKSDLPAIEQNLDATVRKAVRDEFDRARAERSDYRALSDASDSKTRSWLPALLQMSKT